MTFYSNFHRYVTQTSMTRRLFLAFFMVLIAVGVLLAWIIYNFRVSFDNLSRQQEAVRYISYIRPTQQAILLQNFDNTPAIRRGIKESFSKLIAFNDENPNYFDKGFRNNKISPANIYLFWEEGLNLSDSESLNKINKETEKQLAELARLVADKAFASDEVSSLFYRLQQLLVLPLSQEDLVSLLDDLSIDMQAHGIPFRLSNEARALSQKAGEKDFDQEQVNRLFQFYNQVSAQQQSLLEQHYKMLRASKQKILGILLLITFFAISAGIYFLMQITLPLRKILEANARLREGDISVRYPEDDNDEIGLLGKTFNRMTDSFIQMKGQLESTRKKLDTSNSEVSLMATHQEETILDQERIIKQIAVTALEISETVKDLAETMSEVNEAAEITSSMAQTGRSNLQQLELLMQKLVGASNHLTAALRQLNEKTHGISAIISTMVHVADETNMLALNTSLESAKVKDVGKGFSIIANEIRRLADQTAAATLDIEQVVKELMGMMESGVIEVQNISDDILNSVDRASVVQRHFTEIIDKVQYLSSKFSAVAKGMHNQLESARMIDGAIQLLKQVAEDSSRTIRQLRIALDTLHKSVAQLHQDTQEDPLLVKLPQDASAYAENKN